MTLRMTLAEESERDLGLLLRAVIMTGAAAHVWGRNPELLQLLYHGPTPKTFLIKHNRWGSDIPHSRLKPSKASI